MKKRSDNSRLRRQVSSEDILSDHSSDIRALAENLRRLIRETVPEAIEKAYPTWHGIGYRHPRSGYFCAIFPQEDLVKLGFEFGVLLPDPDGLLKGEGKQVRYVIIREEVDIRVHAIQKLIQAALDLPDKREERLWMLKSSARPSKK